MDLLNIVVLALVQGLTEYLPISSSAHLILSPLLFGFADQGLAFDVAVHVGSLGAVMLYFRGEVGRILSAIFTQPRFGIDTADGRLGWQVALATVPVVIIGLAFKGLVETDLRSPLVIAAATIGFGLLLWWADVSARRERDESTLSWADALIIGIAQAVAIIPGTSRSGITMTAGLMLGLTRKAASRFSFLLAIPTILMSGALVTLDLVTADTPVNWLDLMWGITLSFVAALSCITLFLRFIERIGMLPFVLYRLALGAVILSVI